MPRETLTYDWNGNENMPMDGAQFSDMEVAAKVRMLMRDQLDHEAVCVMARDRIMALSKELDRLRPTSALDARSDCFGGLVERAREAAAKASRKFPQPNYVTLKIAEEAGEVVRGAVHYAEGRMEWEEVEGEIVQLLAMLIRFVTEGDQVNGIAPPSASSSPRLRGGDNG